MKQVRIMELLLRVRVPIQTNISRNCIKCEGFTYSVKPGIVNGRVENVSIHSKCLPPDWEGLRTTEQIQIERELLGI